MQNYFTISDFEVFPVFSSPITVLKIQENLTDFFEEIKKEEFVNLSNEKTNRFDNYISKNRYILNKFDREKKILRNTFLRYKNDVLKLRDTDFDITTSWITKTGFGGISHMHKHANVAYSAVVYFQDISDSGEIVFYNNGIRPTSFEFNDPSESNILNFSEFMLKPSKNLMVIFPSYLYHKIEKYTGKEYRYSLALNFVPVGNYGLYDSRVNIKLV